MNGNSLEKGLIEHCAPTLAGLKSAGLFRYKHNGKKSVKKKLQEVNHLLNKKGVYVEDLLWDEDSVLIYTYRFSQLQSELQNEDTRKLLTEYGYKEFDVAACICHLKKRLYHYTCFPHEIGAFLGYPLEDVRGFIENRGQNCKCCGLWKVYCNEQEKMQLFHKLKKCSAIYQQVFSSGRDLVQMTVYA